MALKAETKLTSHHSTEVPDPQYEMRLSPPVINAVAYDQTGCTAWFSTRDLRSVRQHTSQEVISKWNKQLSYTFTRLTNTAP